MASLNELLARKAELEKQIADAQRAERGEAIARVRSLMAEHGLSLADLGARAAAGAAPTAPAPRSAGPKTGTKLPAKYRNPATGQTWSGRGLKPTWLAAELARGDKSLADFAV